MVIGGKMAILNQSVIKSLGSRIESGAQAGVHEIIGEIETFVRPYVKPNYTHALKSGVLQGSPQIHEHLERF